VKQDTFNYTTLGVAICLNLSFHVLCSGIYGVGKAAIHQPALAILSHTPEGAKRTFAWVGKGIVYDTGGLSIKGKVLHQSGNSVWSICIL